MGVDEDGREAVGGLEEAAALRLRVPVVEVVERRRSVRLDGADEGAVPGALGERRGELVVDY